MSPCRRSPEGAPPTSPVRWSPKDEPPTNPGHHTNKWLLGKPLVGEGGAPSLIDPGHLTNRRLLGSPRGWGGGCPTSPHVPSTAGQPYPPQGRSRALPALDWSRMGPGTAEFLSLPRANPIPLKGGLGFLRRCVGARGPSSWPSAALVPPGGPAAVLISPRLGKGPPHSTP